MKTGRRGAVVKGLVLLALAGILIGLLEFSPTAHTLDQFQMIISKAGLVGPALLMILCAVGTCLFIPGTVFVGIGAAMFGPYLGFACVWPGSIAGAVISYLIARRLGRELLGSLIGDRLRKYDDLIERNGFTAVFLLRLMFVPFAPMNYGAGLTKVRFWDYFFATVLGEAVTVFLITFFFGEIRQIWISGARGRLFSTRVALSLGFLAAVALIAKLARRKYENRSVPSLSDSHRPAVVRSEQEILH